MEAAPFDHAAALSACARGDQAAFHRLFDHESPRMLALCQRLLPADPEGLLHDVFALIWRNADQYDAAMGPARPWIYSVLRHVANGHRVRQNAVAPLAAPELPSPTALDGRLANLAGGADSNGYQAIAHAYLHGADYKQLSVWMRRNETQIRRSVRKSLEELSA